jgi:putative peptide zinc metalloprotease protein
MEYFHLGTLEMYVLQQLDGCVSLSELKRRFDQHFAPYRISTQQLGSFIRRLYELGLVVSDVPGQGSVLAGRARQHRRRSIYGAIANPLAIRFRGVDASRFLSALAPLASVVFHPMFVACVGLLSLLACGVAWSNQRAIVTEASQIASTLQGMGPFQWLLVLSVIKVLHELGHGLACRYFGGACREIGAMLLVGTPCLYCNVSDAWMFPRKWPRIAVSLAGIYVDWMLAVMAFWVWQFTLPGTLHALAWNVVTICSIGTLIFNANPLMRYDGYYVLADLMDVPNLAEQSHGALWGRLERWLSGDDGPGQQFDASWTTLATYGILSLAYRLFVTYLITMTLYRWFATHHVSVIGQLLVIFIVVGLVVPWGSSMGRLVQQRSGGRKTPWNRWAVVASLSLATVIGICLIPIPQYVRAPLSVQVIDAAFIRAPYAGRCQRVPAEGVEVDAGDVVIQLENLEFEQELAEAAGEMRILQNQLQSLERRIATDSSATHQRTTAMAAADAARQRWRSVQQKIERLSISTPRPGIVIAGPNVPQTPEDDMQLSRWTGSPLDSENRNCYVEPGELICVIGDPSRLEAVVPIVHEQVALIEVGSSVSMRLNHHPGTTWEGVVREVSHRVETDGSRSDGVANDLLVPNAGILPGDMPYYVRIDFTTVPRGLLHRSGGSAKIRVRSRSLAGRCFRYLRQVFHFHLS